ncbi:MAG TPA: YciI family protein, partial [Croceibacterium sp.]|nr:YciI family protein [Croceibacterium sp.]
ASSARARGLIVAHFIVEYRQLGNSAAREEKRGDHIAYRKGLGARMPLAGPLLDDAGQPVGSLVIVEAGDRAAAEALAAADPYVAAGVLELLSVRGFRIAAIKPPS